MANALELQGLLEYCNYPQREKVECVIRNNGNVTAAARELNYANESTIRNVIRRIQQNVAKNFGYTPEAKLSLF